MVEQSSDPFLPTFLCCLSQPVPPLGPTLPALCRVHMRLNVRRSVYGLRGPALIIGPMPLSTLQVTPHDVPCKTRGQDGFATSFPVGLLHPLQHDGLSRRSPICP